MIVGKMKKGINKFKELFWYSDSEPNEVLIALCHIICLPAALLVEFHNPSIIFIIGGMASGLFQLWAVLWSGRLRYRLIAVQVAAIIALTTIINLSMAGLMEGSRTGWIIILGFAIWNAIRVFKEKLERYD
jgi:hypothetical protein